MRGLVQELPAFIRGSCGQGAQVYSTEPRTLALPTLPLFISHVGTFLEAHTCLLFPSGLGYTAFKNSNFEKDNQTSQE